MKRALIIIAVLVTGAVAFFWGTAEAHGWEVSADCEGLRVSWNDFGDEASDITVTIDGESSTFSATNNGSRVFLWSVFEDHTFAVSTDNPDVNPNPWTGSQQACQSTTTSTEVTTSTSTTSPTTSTTTSVPSTTSSVPPSTSEPPSTTSPPSTESTTTSTTDSPSTTGTVPPTSSTPPSTSPRPTLPPRLPSTGLSADMVAALALVAAALLLVGGTMVWRGKR